MPYKASAPPPLTPARETDGPISEPVIPVTAVTKLLEMSLEEFSQQENGIEVRVPWLAKTIWFVPGIDGVERLLAEGIRRGRIWTAAELEDLYSIEDPSKDEIRSIAKLKATFGAEIVGVRDDDETVL